MKSRFFEENEMRNICKSEHYINIRVLYMQRPGPIMERHIDQIYLSDTKEIIIYDIKN